MNNQRGNRRKSNMTDKHEGMRRLVFAVPVSVAEAIEAAAEQELASVSYICRRALLNELKARGLLEKIA
jgi:hypothetical protein